MWPKVSLCPLLKTSLISSYIFLQRFDWSFQPSSYSHTRQNRRKALKVRHCLLDTDKKLKEQRAESNCMHFLFCLQKLCHCTDRNKWFMPLFMPNPVRVYRWVYSMPTGKGRTRDSSAAHRVTVSWPIRRRYLPVQVRASTKRQGQKKKSRNMRNFQEKLESTSSIGQLPKEKSFPDHSFVPRCPSFLFLIFA